MFGIPPIGQILFELPLLGPPVLSQIPTTAPPPSLQEQRASRRSPLVDNGDNDDDDNDNSLGLTLLYAGGIVREAVKDGGRYVGGRQRTTAEGGSLVVKGGGVENWLLSGGEQLMCG